METNFVQSPQWNPGCPSRASWKFIKVSKLESRNKGQFLKILIKKESEGATSKLSIIMNITGSPI